MNATASHAGNSSRSRRPSVVVVDVNNMPAAGDDAAWGRRLRPDEMAACRQFVRPRGHLAARVTAKRALLALLGWQGGGGERDIEVVGGAGTRPRLVIEGAVAARARHLGIGALAVSLSHSDGYAGAMVVASPLAAAGHRPAPGCGIDLLDISRWALAVHRGGTPLLERVTAPAEWAADTDASSPPTTRSAARFALKECVVKAIGGFPAGGGFHDVVITFDEHARPRVRCAGAVARRLESIGSTSLDASMAAPVPGLLQAAVIIDTAGER